MAHASDSIVGWRREIPQPLSATRIGLKHPVDVHPRSHAILRQDDMMPLAIDNERITKCVEHAAVVELDEDLIAERIELDVIVIRRAALDGEDLADHRN